MNRMYRKVKDDNTALYGEINNALSAQIQGDVHVSPMYCDGDIITLAAEYDVWNNNRSTIKSVMADFGFQLYNTGGNGDMIMLDFKSRVSDSRRIKDDEYGSEMDFGGDDFPSILEAFKSVYNEENLQEVAYRDLALVDDSYFYKDRYDNIARFDFNHPNAQFTFTSGYTCGSREIDDIVYDNFNETYDEVVAEYKKDYPDMQEGDAQDDDAWDEAYRYEGEHTGITYVVMLEGKQDGVHIEFSIGCGYYTATEYGEDMIIEKVVNNSDEAISVAQEILDFIGGIHFD